MNPAQLKKLLILASLATLPACNLSTWGKRTMTDCPTSTSAVRMAAAAPAPQPSVAALACSMDDKIECELQKSSADVSTDDRWDSECIDGDNCFRVHVMTTNTEQLGPEYPEVEQYVCKNLRTGYMSEGDSLKEAVASLQKGCQ